MKRAPVVLALCAGSAWLLLLASFALRWRTQHDAPLMFYIAWMMDARGAVPYRDIMDMNLPGTYVANLVIGRLTGYSDPGIRIADLSLLAAILTLTFFAMSRFGRLVAWAAAVLFGLFYIGTGPWLSLQREFFILLPLSLALLLVSRYDRRKPGMTAFAIGFLMACAATVKPHVLVGAPLFVGFLWLEGTPDERRARTRHLASIIGGAAAGAAIPTALLVLYLVSHDAWSPMVELFRGYASVYASVNGRHETMPGADRGPYLLHGLLQFGNQRTWLLFGAAGAVLALTARPGPNRRFVLLLGALLAAYTGYVVVQGRFFDYHWLIAHFFVLLIASLCLIERPDLWARSALLGLAPAAALALFAWRDLPVHADLGAQLRGETLPAPKRGRPDKIATFLAARLRPGDLVQPLDITGGAVHGMLLARAPLATPFLYDSFFYIRVSDPFVLELRRRFLRQMAERVPRFVVDVYGPDKPWVRGWDTSREFPELRTLLVRDYVPVGEALGTVIYERRSSSGMSASP